MGSQCSAMSRGAPRSSIVAICELRVQCDSLSRHEGRLPPTRRLEYWTICTRVLTRVTRGPGGVAASVLRRVSPSSSGPRDRPTARDVPDHCARCDQERNEDPLRELPRAVDLVDLVEVDPILIDVVLGTSRTPLTADGDRSPDDLADVRSHGCAVGTEQLNNRSGGGLDQYIERRTGFTLEVDELPCGREVHPENRALPHRIGGEDRGHLLEIGPRHRVGVAVDQLLNRVPILPRTCVITHRSAPLRRRRRDITQAGACASCQRCVRSATAFTAPERRIEVSQNAG